MEPRQPELALRPGRSRDVPLASLAFVVFCIAACELSQLLPTLPSAAGRPGLSLGDLLAAVSAVPLGEVEPAPRVAASPV